jgi:ADP-heptose:LPS heptosyltransferase
MIQLRKSLPSAFALTPSNNLGMYLAILAQAKVVISGDTGPLHFAAGLGVKVIEIVWNSRFSSSRRHPFIKCMS